MKMFGKVLGAAIATCAAGAALLPGTAFADSQPSPRGVDASPANGIVKGSINTLGNVALDGGRFTFRDNTTGRAGADTVAKSSSTAFEDAAKYYGNCGCSELAQADFAYRIVDAGTPTNYWIKGEASVSDHQLWWGHDSECTIYGGDPDRGGVPVDDSGYHCDMTSDGSNPWNVHFTVS